MSKEKSAASTYEIWKRLRNDWGAINPVTKVIPNKKKNQKAKHKKKEVEQYE